MGNCMNAPFQDPVVHLKSLWLENANLTGGTFNVGLFIENPNTYSMDVTKLAYTVAKVSDGTEIAEGSLADPRIHLPGNGSTDAHMKVAISFRGVGAAMASITRGKGKVRYRIAGKITVASPKMKGVTIPFSSEETFDVFEPLRDTDENNGNVAKN